jgi:hypothetical protein
LGVIAGPNKHRTSLSSLYGTFFVDFHVSKNKVIMQVAHFNTNSLSTMQANGASRNPVTADTIKMPYLTATPYSLPELLTTRFATN